MIAIAVPIKELGSRAEARTKSVERCLKMKPDYILFLDSDQTMPNKALEAMLALDSDIAVIDTPPHDSEARNYVLNPDGTVAHTTIACSLIKASVFNNEIIPHPWFSSDFIYIRTTAIKEGKYVYERLDKVGLDNAGEDIHFVRQAIEAGLTIQIVQGMKCSHFKL